MALHFPAIGLMSRVFANGAPGVMVIILRIGHGDTSSNPRPGWLQFT